jgi:hypothetical protein
MTQHTKTICKACGFPQSYPIPHEHDLSDREKQIIAYYKAKACNNFDALVACLQNLVDRNLIKDIDGDHYQEALEALNNLRGN